MFGVSSFILGGKTSWVAKVGNKTITYDKFLQTAQNDKEAIYRSNPNKDVTKYLNSDQFKQDVLGRMVTRNLVESLQQEFQIYPDKDLILKEITTNPALQKDGKFDRNLYKNLLKSNGLTEKQHIDNLADEMIGGLIVQALAESPNASEKLATDLYQHRFQTRNADLVLVSIKNVGNVNNPNDFELNGFFDQNKDKFILPELRQVSFISFDINNLKQEIKITDEEIKKEYEANKSEYETPEMASFYHILFAEEVEAKAFYQELKTEAETNKATNKGEVFMKLATASGKDKSAVALSKISKKELPVEIANPAFALNKDQYSEVIKSKLGFHIFYLVDKTPSAEIPLAKIKDQIKAKLLASKEESQVRDNLKNVEDEILATNSLEKVAAKLHIAINKNIPKFSANGSDIRQNQVVDLNNLDNFTKNSFALEKGKVSKIFASDTNKKYYIILVEEIDPSRKRSLDEVKVAATDLWIASKKQQKLRELASEISKKINQNGGNAAAIAERDGLKLEKNRPFPRFYMIDAGNGKKVPYANKLLNEIFALKINQATNPQQTSQEEMVIAVVRSISNPAPNNAGVKAIAKDIEGNFRNDILVSFNQYVQKQFPVKINEKLMQNSNNKAGDEQ